MLAKRLIVLAFAAVVVIVAPFALPGQRDLFVDFQGSPRQVAAN